MIVWNLVLVWILMSLFKDTAGTACSDAVTDVTTVLNMCEDGKAVGDHVVIDTYGSSVYRKDGYSTNCFCTATLMELSNGTETTVEYGPVHSLYPLPGCGSSVIISTQLAAFNNSNTYLCTVGNNTINHVQTNDTITVVWESILDESTSGYCLLFRAGQGSSLSTKCNPAVNTTTSPTSPSTTPSTTSPSTAPSTTTPRTTAPPTSTTVMTSLMTTTTTTTAGPTTTITSTIGGGTNGGGATTSSAKPTMSPEATTMADKIKDKNLDN